jgi:phosphoesterase RecJ-like protein
VKSEIIEFRKLIEGATSIAVVAHERPDGDAIGSLIALTLSLQNAGKQVTSILADGVPNRFRFLPGSDGVQRNFPTDCNLLIALDCSDVERTGFEVEDLPRNVDINVDHHPTNTHFGAVNIVDPHAAATAEILFDLVESLGLEIDSYVATNLLTGLVTDTIGFRTTNVTPKVLHMVAQLIELGAPLAEIYERALNRRSVIAARYWGRGLSRLEQEDGLVWTSLTLEDRQRVGYSGKDDADLINLLTTIDGAEVTVIFVEQPKGAVKVSWRSRAGLNITPLAEVFGGGGHHQAAGAMIVGELEEVTKRVISATRGILASDSEMRR